MFRVVEIGRRIEGEELEKILIESAREVGLNAKGYDRYETDYVLGSVHEKRGYRETEVRIKGRLVPFATLRNIHKGMSENFFIIQTGVPNFSFASRKRIQRYLEAVSKRVV